MFPNHQDMAKFLLPLAALLLWGSDMSAQSMMRVHLHGRNPVDFPVGQIDSVTFATVEEEPVQKGTLAGTWYWEGREQGYSETLTFNADGTFTCLDHYFDYGLDSSTYGIYMFFGSMLSMRSNGYGYSRFYQWMVTELTAKRLKVLTRMGSFTYMREGMNDE